MKSIFVLILVLSAVSTCLAQQHTEHPRLFFSASDIQTIQSRTNDAGTATYQLYNDNLVRLSNFFTPGAWNNSDDTEWATTITNGLNFASHTKDNYYHIVLSLAFRYIVSGDTTFANQSIRLIFNAPKNGNSDPVEPAQGVKSLFGGTMSDALKLALAERRADEAVLITGSHFVVGEILEVQENNYGFHY